MPDNPQDALNDARDLHVALCSNPGVGKRITEVADMLAETFRNGGKLLACGNGGSACDAAHLCEEFTGRFRRDRKSLPAISCTDAGHLTCTANDYGYNTVFARWVEGLGRPDDVLFVLTTSGNSPNVVAAVEVAESAGLKTVALLGKGGGTLRGRCTYEWVVPGRTAERIQELHKLIIHTLVDQVEQRMMD